ncbi:MAG: N-acetylglucosamine kinase, partial [Bacteroidia bacterium]
MLVIADSGSTKADWLLAENGKVIRSFSTMGFNPFFHDSQTVLKELNKNKSLKKYSGKIKEVHFFGAGCSSRSRNKIIADGLKKFFKTAKITVEHDLLASALATCNGKPGITCILGTGSNACYFDGKKLAEVRHGLGYVLGDEGSASFFGKKLLAFYLYKILPADLDADFKRKYRLSKEKIVNHVYHKPNPNVYLASYSKFLSRHIHHPYIKKLISDGMKYFLETNVVSYKEHKKVP